MTYQELETMISNLKAANLTDGILDLLTVENVNTADNCKPGKPSGMGQQAKIKRPDLLVQAYLDLRANIEADPVGQILADHFRIENVLLVSIGREYRQTVQTTAGIYTDLLYATPQADAEADVQAYIEETRKQQDPKNNQPCS